MATFTKITIFATTLQKPKLIKLKKYKSLIAVILLTVYAFIATPIQIWHHHDVAASASNPAMQTANKATITATAADNKTINDNCQICSHHYSIYANDAEPAFEIFISCINPKEGFYALAILLAPYFNSTNKGPPALA